MQVPGLHHEAMLLLWILAESQDKESLWAPFWRSLPLTIGTGGTRFSPPFEKGSCSFGTLANTTDVIIASCQRVYRHAI